MATPTARENAEARRNALILAMASSVSGSAPPVAITLGGLAGLYLLGSDKTLATLPVSTFNLGVALGALTLLVIRNGLTLVRVDPLWLQGIYGLVILVAIGIDALVVRRTRRAR